MVVDHTGDFVFHMIRLLPRSKRERAEIVLKCDGFTSPQHSVRVPRNLFTVCMRANVSSKGWGMPVSANPTGGLLLDTGYFHGPR